MRARCRQASLLAPPFLHRRLSAPFSYIPPFHHPPRSVRLFLPHRQELLWPLSCSVLYQAKARAGRSMQVKLLYASKGPWSALCRQAAAAHRLASCCRSALSARPPGRSSSKLLRQIEGRRGLVAAQHASPRCTNGGSLYNGCPCLSRSAPRWKISCQADPLA